MGVLADPTTGIARKGPSSITTVLAPGVRPKSEVGSAMRKKRRRKVRTIREDTSYGLAARSTGQNQA